MKKVTFMALAFMLSVATLFASNQQTQPAKSSKTTQQTTATYTCPMHPEVSSNKPGKCPKCGMALEKKAMAGKACKMDKCTTHCSPCDCPKCDKSGKKAMAGKACKMDKCTTNCSPCECAKCTKASEKKAMANYTCPMHQEISSNKPGKCPKCGMDLKKA